MRILGIDPGVGRTGWGVLEVESGKLKVENYGCFETPPKSPIETRLVSIFDHITSLITKHKPEEMATEELFFNTNVKTALQVGQARGVVLLAAAQKGVTIASYTPLQVKIAVTGYGRAEKAQVGKMIKTLLGLPKIPTPDDTTDALAVAVTHALSRRMKAI